MVVLACRVLENLGTLLFIKHKCVAYESLLQILARADKEASSLHMRRELAGNCGKTFAQSLRKLLHRCK